MPLKQAMVYCYCYTYFDDNSLFGTRSGIQGYSNHIMSKTYKMKLYLLAINFQRQKQAFIISILPTNRRGSHLLNWSIDACQGWGLIIYWSWHKKNYRDIRHCPWVSTELLAATHSIHPRVAPLQREGEIQLSPDNTRCCDISGTHTLAGDCVNL